ncbi:hypothetical protein ACHAPJ_012666 [Fusarium lateritium]
MDESHNHPIEDAMVIKREKFTVKTLSQSTAHYSGEFSHWNFSHKVYRKVGRYLGAPESPSRPGCKPPTNEKDDTSRPAPQKPKYIEYWRATHLQGPSSRVRDVFDILPPKNIAKFLAKVYFEFAQVNSFFVDERWLRAKLELLYAKPEIITSSSTAWVCSVVLVLAIGTQFAHMSAGELAVVTSGDAENEPTEMDAGTVFYQTATTLLPDIITIASLESVQACLLLAHYTLPVDAHGLAYTYLGLAIKMGIQNGMHRKSKGLELDALTVEMRNRLWWTAFTIERRVSVLHGRPASITAMEMDTELPKDMPEFRQDDKPSKFDNMMAMIHFTDNLADIATVLKYLKKCAKDLQETYFERILSIHEKTLAWWLTLPEDIQTPSESSPLFRPNVHVKLTYHLVQIFTGRSFIFIDSSPGLFPDGPGHDELRQSRRAVLVSDALEASFNVITLLELLHETIGLARASYTEFSSCRAALLLLLAHNLSQSTERLRMAVRQGMRFIKLMSVGSNMSNKSEASLIESIESAVRRIHSREHDEHLKAKEDEKQELQTSYDRFKEWTALCVGATSLAANNSSSYMSSESTAPDNNGLPDLIFPGAQKAGDTISDSMNWTRQMSDDLETAINSDILTTGQMEDSGSMATTFTSESSWEEATWQANG